MIRLNSYSLGPKKNPLTNPPASLLNLKRKHRWHLNRLPNATSVRELHCTASTNRLVLETVIRLKDWHQHSIAYLRGLA